MSLFGAIEAKENAGYDAKTADIKDEQNIIAKPKEELEAPGENGDI